MYSLVLMMALSDGAALPSPLPQETVVSKRAGAQELNRGHRRGCCGCCGGCYGCYGGCYGGGCYGGCYGGGCYGGCYGGGCYGGYGCYGGGMVAPAAPATGGAPPAPPEPAPAPKKKDEAKSAAPATIVSLPADAKLTIDDTPTTSTSASRVFSTPTLESGREYFYTLKASVTRDGKVQTATQRVAVRAGQTSQVSLDVPNASGVASSK